MNKYIHIYIHVYICIYICVYIYIYVCVYICLLMSCTCAASARASARAATAAISAAALFALACATCCKWSVGGAEAEGLTFTRYCFTSKLYYGSQSSLYCPLSFLQSLPYCNTSARPMRNIHPLHRPPLCMP